MIYSEEVITTAILTTTATTTNNKVNSNSGTRLVKQIVAQGRKYKYKLRKQGRYMRNSGPRLVIKL